MRLRERVTKKFYIQLNYIWLQISNFEHANVPFLKKLLEMNFGQVSENLTVKRCAVGTKYMYLYNQDKPKCKNIWSGHLEMV